MSFKISGTKTDTARIIVIRQDTWEIEANTVISGSGEYEIPSLASGTKTVLAETESGQGVTYGGVESYYYLAYDRGIFFGGAKSTGDRDDIDYITIGMPGDAQDFGNLSTPRYDLAATSNGTYDRGLAMASYGSDLIDYVTIMSLGNSQSFGVLTLGRQNIGATSNGTNNRGIAVAGMKFSTYYNIIDYVTISTTGDAINFGDLNYRAEKIAACSNATNDRGIFAGGKIGSTTITPNISYRTISTTGDAADFGDLSLSRSYLAGTSNGPNNKGIFGGGGNYSGDIKYNTIDYVTISSLGNAQDFGDLYVITRWGLAATSDGTNNRAVFAGGYASNYTNLIDYVTITSNGDAQDFGDLTTARAYFGGTSNA